jgi:serine/threonine protein kinase
MERIRVDMADLRIGQEPIPGYRLTEQLMTFDLTRIYKAEGPGGFPVALQFKPRDQTSHQRLLDESVDLMTTIRHPHLLAIFGVWRNMNTEIVAMELTDSTLEGRLREVRQTGCAGIARGELLEYMHDAAEGIDFLNELRHTLRGKAGMSVIHGDIKPRHLRLVGGQVKVAEFLFAECFDPARLEGDSRNDIRGTAAFMAPERVRGKTSLQTDQYSLAASYYQLRTGRYIFPAGTPSEFLQKRLETDPDLVEVPVEERRVLSRALAREPHDRWSNCQSFIDALSAVVSP